MSRPEMSLTSRVVVINMLVLSAGTLWLIVSPATISQEVLVSEVTTLVLGLALMIVANTLLVRNALRPLEQLVHHLDDARGTEPLERVGLPEGGLPRRLAASVNDLFDRIEQGTRERGVVALAAQEAESARIAQGLHDGVGQTLTAVLLDLGRLAETAQRPDGPDREQLVEEVERIREATRVSLDEVRRTARRLRPHVLEDLGLRSALVALTNDLFRDGSVRVERSMATGLPALHEAVELVVFRVAQEALTNVVRHARASRVDLIVRIEDGGLELEVRDDGVGIAAELWDEDGEVHGGTGLRGMRERAASVGGRLQVRSTPGEGTALWLRVALGAAPLAGATGLRGYGLDA